MSDPVGTARLCPVGPGAAPALADIHARAFDDPWTVGSLQALFDSPGVLALAAMSADAPIGFVLTRIVCDEAEVLTLAVQPEARRRGVAGALVQAAIAAAEGGGARLMWLEVANDNIAALALYRRLGFEQAGRRRGYYRRGGSAIDALVLRRALNTPAA